MTNDVEKIILNNQKVNELTYAENKAYMLYKEIWKFLLFIKDETFDTIRIKFSFFQDNNFVYINRTDGITYTLQNNNQKRNFHNYYQGCEPHYIDLLFSTNIDIYLFFRLISLDGFYYGILKDDNPVLVCIEVEKNQIEQKIKETLLKNKILKK